MSDAADPFSDRALVALLAGYALGALDTPLHALVAAHLALSPQNRRFVLSLEAANGVAIETAEPMRVPDRKRRLEQIFASDGPAPAAPATPASPPDAGLPAPLALYLGMGLEDIPWRPSPGHAGAEVHSAEEDGRRSAALHRVQPHRDLPPLARDASDATVVLRGGFRHPSGAYGPGDILVAHRGSAGPSTAGPEGCLYFTVTHAAERLIGPLGRVLQLVFEQPP